MMNQPPVTPPNPEMQGGMDPQMQMRRMMMAQMLQRMPQQAAGGNPMVGAGSSAILQLLPLLMARQGGNMPKGPDMGGGVMPPGPNGMMTGGV